MHLSQIHDELGTWCKVKRNERNFRFTAIKKSKRGENRLISLYFNCFFFRSICVINCGGERPLKMRTPRQIFEINLILICALIRHFGQQVAFSASFLGPSVWPRMWCERVTEMFALANERLWSKFHADHSATQSVDSIGSWTKRLAILIQRGQRLTTWVSANTFWLVSNGKCLATTIYGTAFDFKAAQANNNNQTIPYRPIEIFSRSNFGHNTIANEIVVDFVFFFWREMHSVTCWQFECRKEILKSSIDAGFAQNQKCLSRIHRKTNFE